MYDIIVTKKFEEDIEYYKKKKRFTKIIDDISSIISELEAGNFVGDEIDGVKLPDNEHSYKVRAANSNTKVGKSNGYRMIYYVVKDDFEVYLITIYYKKDDKNIPNKNEIAKLISKYC